VPAAIEAPISNGDTEARRRRKQFFIGFSPRLRASARTSGVFLPTETLILSRRRRDAEECIAIRFSGFPVSPCLRESIGFLPKHKPGTLAKARRRQEELQKGVLRALASSREKSCPPQSKPQSLTETRRHGEGGNNSLSGFLRASAAPREHSGFLPTETLILSRRRRDAEECRAIRFSGFPVPPWPRESIGFLPEHKPGTLAKARRRQEKH
jgi:hypothetical protein